MSKSSAPSRGILVKVGTYPPRYSKPVAVILNGERVAVRHWCRLLFATAEWLIERGKPLPYDQIRPGADWVLVSPDRHRIEQRPRLLSNGCYIGVDYAAIDCVKQAQWLMSHAGYPNSSFTTEYVERR